jgi:FAD/FMN-containing dehydrogenase
MGMSRTQAFGTALDEFAASAGATGPIAVEGRRTRWDAGGELLDSTRLVSAPSGIVSFEPAEMIVTVRTGTLVSELDTALAEHRQRAALPDRGGTVGGAIAVGENVVEFLGRGGLRASVLQVRYVTAEGKIVTGGGPTVKNVTGFDLPRLMVGSLGTLGLLAEVILRTNPIPPVQRWFASESADPATVKDAVQRPGAVLFDGRRTWVLLEGHAADVESSLRVLSARADYQEVAGPPTLPAHRWRLRPSDLTNLSTFDMGKYVASIGVGLVFADRVQPNQPLSSVVRALSKRVKESFDPTGRLNPGRVPGASS